jgi:hypothetical protein
VSGGCRSVGPNAVERVIEDTLRIARAWIAEAAAALQRQADGVAYRHGLPAVRPYRAAGAQRHYAPIRRAGRRRGLAPGYVGRKILQA